MRDDYATISNRKPSPEDIVFGTNKNEDEDDDDDNIIGPIDY